MIIYVMPATTAQALLLSGVYVVQRGQHETTLLFKDHTILYDQKNLVSSYYEFSLNHLQLYLLKNSLCADSKDKICTARI